MSTIYNIVSVLSLLATVIWSINGDAYLASQYCIIAFVAQILSKMGE